MTKKLTDCGVSRRDLMRLGAGGLGFGMFGGLGPVPYVFSKASEVASATDSGKILVVFEWFGGNDGLNTIVPYGDANELWNWRAPFDEGEYGLGTLLAPLTRGGQVPDNAVLLYSVVPTGHGAALVIPGSIALSERDGGVLWQHTDPETMRLECRRARELVITCEVVAGNYDYGINWIFGQDGQLRAEVELGGIPLAFGTGIGSVLLSPLADIFGRKKIMVTAVTLFGLLTLCTVALTGIDQAVTRALPRIHAARMPVAFAKKIILDALKGA